MGGRSARPFLLVLLWAGLMGAKAEARLTPSGFVALPGNTQLVTPAVVDIQQDRHGFVWFGTRSGLVRYDGSVLRYYTYDPTDPHSLPNNPVFGLLLDQDANLWVSTTVGFRAMTRSGIISITSSAPTIEVRTFSSVPKPSC